MLYIGYVWKLTTCWWSQYGRIQVKSAALCSPSWMTLCTVILETIPDYPLEHSSRRLSRISPLYSYCSTKYYMVIVYITCTVVYHLFVVIVSLRCVLKMTQTIQLMPPLPQHVTVLYSKLSIKPGMCAVLIINLILW